MVLAGQVCEPIITELPQLTYTGQLIPMPIGSHPKPIFKIHIFSADINYAMLTFKSLRQGLSVLIHPVQHDEMAAHTDGARWLSQKIAA